MVVRLLERSIESHGTSLHRNELRITREVVLIEWLLVYDLACRIRERLMHQLPVRGPLQGDQIIAVDLHVNSDRTLQFFVQIYSPIINLQILIHYRPAHCLVQQPVYQLCSTPAV